MSYFFKKVTLNNHCWSVLSRVIAASVGGYAVATSSSLFITQLFIHFLGKYQAIHVGLLLFFLIYACAAIWSFAVESAKNAWLGLLGCNLILLGVTWLLVEVNR